MPFEFERLNAAQLREVQPRLLGPVYQLQPVQVIDRARGLVLLDLGGHGDQPPERAECPSFYNLFWGDEVVAFQGYDQLSTVDGALTVTLSLTGLSLPARMRASREEAMHLIEEAASAYWRGRFGRAIAARVRLEAAV